MFYNPYLVIPFISWLIAQTVKFVLAAFRGNLDLRNLYASGGMPSVHSAVVCSLATTALLIDGPQSQIFGLTALFAAIVMYDSFGVRRASGEHAAALNMLIRSLSVDNNRMRLLQPELKLREVLGHRPLEVAVGAILGILLGCLFNYEKLTAQIGFLTASPARVEYLVYAAIGAVLILGSFMARVWLGIRFKKSLAVAGFARDMLISAQSIGWLALLVAFSARERVAFLSWRLWVIVLLLVAILLAAGIYRRYSVSLPLALQTEAEARRKRRWLPKPKRKKRR